MVHPLCKGSSSISHFQLFPPTSSSSFPHFHSTRTISAPFSHFFPASNCSSLSRCPRGSSSTWEKPRTSPDKVTNPSHFAALSHCAPDSSKLCECVTADRWERVTQVQGVSYCNKALRQLWAPPSSDSLEVHLCRRHLIRVTSLCGDSFYNVTSNPKKNPCKKICTFSTRAWQTWQGPLTKVKS